MEKVDVAFSCSICGQPYFQSDIEGDYCYRCLSLADYLAFEVDKFHELVLCRVKGGKK